MFENESMSLMLLLIPVLFMLLRSTSFTDGGDGAGGGVDAGADAGGMDSGADSAGDGDRVESPAADSHPAAEPEAPDPAGADPTDNLDADIERAKAELAAGPQKQAAPRVAAPPAPPPNLPQGLQISPDLFKDVPQHLRGPVQQATAAALQQSYETHIQPFVGEVMQWYEQLGQTAEQLQGAQNFIESYQTSPARQVFEFLHGQPQALQAVLGFLRGDQPAAGNGQPQPPDDLLSDLNLEELDPETARVVSKLSERDQQWSQRLSDLQQRYDHITRALEESGERQRAFEAHQRDTQLQGYSRDVETQLTSAIQAAKKQLGFDPQTYKREWATAREFMAMAIRGGHYRLGDPIAPLLQAALQHARFDTIADRRKQQQRSSARPPATDQYGRGDTLDDQIAADIDSARAAMPRAAP